jgi:hypothetical protein
LWALNELFQRPSANFRIIGAIIYFIVFSSPNSNTLCINSKNQNVLEMSASFLAEVLTFIKNHEMNFSKGHFGFIENILS